MGNDVEIMGIKEVNEKFEIEIQTSNRLSWYGW